MLVSQEMERERDGEICLGNRNEIVSCDNGCGGGNDNNNSS